VVARDGQLHYCNAGQEPPLVLQATGESWLETGGPVIGLLEDVAYEAGEVTFAPGDLLAVVTDGVTEALDGGSAALRRLFEDGPLRRDIASAVCVGCSASLARGVDRCTLATG
jgi:serine phosphatase RsbU (regulator of sigma subunit)